MSTQRELKNFSDYFIEVCERKISADKDQLRELRDEVVQQSGIYGEKAVTFLADCIDCERVLPCKSGMTREAKEKETQRRIVAGFDKIFPEYRMIGEEYRVKGIGRIDILAEEKRTRRKVIIELKVDGKNPVTQLLSYATAFDSPVLVAITEKHINKEQRYEGVRYLEFSEIDALSVL